MQNGCQYMAGAHFFNLRSEVFRVEIVLCFLLASPYSIIIFPVCTGFSLVEILKK